MKNISFILGILILALALKPCSDGFCSDSESETEICSDQGNEHEENHDDSCAMLCVCNCCGVLVVFQKPQTFNLHSKKNISTQVNTHYESHYRFDMLFAIWQPPQVLNS
ncbi:DUF6660 family protein [Kordia sp.]|uniref:DUF6660 family protein n=1 Tax=Kordia sp. TaxID=1965332 RepID=UPI003B5C2EF6